MEFAFLPNSQKYGRRKKGIVFPKSKNTPVFRLFSLCDKCIITYYDDFVNKKASLYTREAQTTDKVEYSYRTCQNLQKLVFKAFLRRKDKVRRNGRGTNEIAQRATQLKAV